MIPFIIHIKYLYISSKRTMLENYNYLDETELLSLMLNKDEFLRYITQQYNNNKCCTQLDPLIWAIHLNIPKYQRLLLLENIILQNAQYIKTKYSFLPEKLILGKTYEVLGIPTVCGEPDKCFLNAYKKYKSYYPVRYPKKEKSLKNVIDHSTEIKTNQNFSKRYSIPTIVNQEIQCSTPATNRIPSFEIYPLLSPIFDKHISSIDKFYNKDSILISILSEYTNKTQNNMNDMQMLSTSKNLDLSGFNILNTSYKSTFNDVQNLNVTETNYLDDTQSQMVFISRSPKHIQTINNILQSYENDLSNMWSEESFKTVSKDKNFTISAYFDDLKKEKYEELTFKTPPKLHQGEKSAEVSRKSLSGKIKKSLGPKHSKKLQVRTHRAKTNIHKTKNPYTNSKNNESWTTQKSIFSDISSSDSNNTPITKKSNLWTNKCHNKIVQESFKLGYNDTWEKNINNLSSDVESTNYNSRENMKTNKNSSLILNLREQDKNIKHNESSESHTSSSMFSNCNFLPNWKRDDSLQLESIKHKFKKESQDSCDSNYNFKENCLENNKVAVSFKKTLFENTPESISKVNLSILSALDTSLSSICTVNTSTHIASSEEQKTDKNVEN